jgi:hypothetical protein
VLQTSTGPAIGWLQTVRVSDAGRTLEPTVTVDDWFVADEEGSLLPVLAVDPGSAAFTRRLYVAWIDIRGGRDRVWLSYSIDGGRSWSRGRTVDDVAAGSDRQRAPRATHPSIAVNRQGVVAVAWADRRGHADNLGWDYRLAASFDGGETFSPSVNVSSGSQTFNTWPLYAVPQWAYGLPGFALPRTRPDRVTQQIMRQASDLSGGHTVDMIVDAQDVFHPIWLDNRTGVMQVWTAPVTVAGRASGPDTTQLAGLISVRSALSLESREMSYDPAAQMAVLSTRVVNTSNAPVPLPVTLHVTDLASDLGSVRIVNADNGAEGVGAIWTFAGAQSGDRELAPGAASASRELRVRVTLTDPSTGPFDPQWRLFRYEAQLLAPRSVH